MCRRIGHGFTLIELLVALAVLALLAAMGWRGTAAMLSVRDDVERTSRTLLGWQTALAQWQADWDAWAVMGTVDRDTDMPRWSMRDGVVRWVRRAPVVSGQPSGWQVVAWGIVVDETGQRRWTRWASAPVRDEAALVIGWATAPQRLAQEGARTVAVEAWTLQAWRDGDWRPPEEAILPAALQLVLEPSAGTGLHGPIRVDWVAPGIAGSKR